MFNLATSRRQSLILSYFTIVLDSYYGHEAHQQEGIKPSWKHFISHLSLAMGMEHIFIYCVSCANQKNKYVARNNILCWCMMNKCLSPYSVNHCWIAFISYVKTLNETHFIRKQQKPLCHNDIRCNSEKFLNARKVANMDPIRNRE